MRQRRGRPGRDHRRQKKGAQTSSRRTLPHRAGGKDCKQPARPRLEGGRGRARRRRTATYLVTDDDVVRPVQQADAHGQPCVAQHREEDVEPAPELPRQAVAVDYHVEKPAARRLLKRPPGLKVRGEHVDIVGLRRRAQNGRGGGTARRGPRVQREAAAGQIGCCLTPIPPQLAEVVTSRTRVQHMFSRNAVRAGVGTATARPEPPS